MVVCACSNHDNCHVVQQSGGCTEPVKLVKVLKA